MNKSAPYLCRGDKIAIVAPAKSIDKEHVFFAKSFFESKGFEVELGKHCLGKNNYFSGSIAERTSDFQSALDDPTIKAVICARGGYGCVQIVDKIQWAVMLRAPKWVVGFSDVTVFHSRLEHLGIQSIHGTMPLNFAENSPESLNSMIDALTGRPYKIWCDPTSHNVRGKARGKLVGGNLSVLCSLLGTNDQIDYANSVLFVEDLSEYTYKIDRMFYSLQKAGVLDQISAVIVGGITDTLDTTPPFGASLEELIASHVAYRNIPIAFGFPSGHFKDNRALLLGSNVSLAVGGDGTQLSLS